MITLLIFRFWFAEKCKIIGYGATEYTGKTPNPLSVAYVNLITNDECTDIMGRIMGPRMENVCALSKGAMDTCQVVGTKFLYRLNFVKDNDNNTF